MVKSCGRCGGVRRASGRWCLACHAAHMRLTRPRYRDLTKAQKKKSRARAYVNSYQRRGLIKPAPCSDCGSPAAEKHHEDYGRPLDITWLCRACHLARHAAKLED